MEKVTISQNIASKLSDESAQLVRQDLDKLDKHGIVYQSLQIVVPKDRYGKYIRKKDYPDRFEKIQIGTPRFANMKLKSRYDKSKNGTMIPMGAIYNLIGIDIDNKDGTLQKYQAICDKHKHDRNTFTLKTMHDGDHEYYRMSSQQLIELADFKSLDGQLFDLHIDVKYNNQFLYGPGIIKADKQYRYRVSNDSEPAQLPQFLFQEILKCMRFKKPPGMQAKIHEKVRMSGVEVSGGMELYLSGSSSSKAMGECDFHDKRSEGFKLDW